GLAVILGFILLIIPGIVLAVWFSQVVFIYAIEGGKGSEVLGRSRQYVIGRWWQVLGRLIVIGLVSLLISFIISAIFDPSSHYGLIIILLSALITPFVLAYSYHLYLALRENEATV